MTGLIPRRRARAASALAFVCLLPAFPDALSDDILARSRAAYVSLKSYADTGTVTYEYGTGASPVTDRHTFKTYFRAPRHYYFEFNEDKKTGGERFVVWSDEEAFHSWWSTTGIEETFPRGKGAGAFVAGSVRTAGALLKIAPLLFSQAGLQGTLTEVTEMSDQGLEDLNGRKCHRLSGIARSVYPATGHVTNVRRTTVWIDAESLLVRKVFEDTPRGQIAGSIMRYTTTFEPQANPTLDDGRFRFTAPPTQD